MKISQIFLHIDYKRGMDDLLNVDEKNGCHITFDNITFKEIEQIYEKTSLKNARVSRNVLTTWPLCHYFNLDLLIYQI